MQKQLFLLVVTVGRKSGSVIRTFVNDILFVNCIAFSLDLCTCYIDKLLKRLMKHRNLTVNKTFSRLTISVPVCLPFRVSDVKTINIQKS